MFLIFNELLSIKELKHITHQHLLLQVFVERKIETSSHSPATATCIAIY